MSDEGRPGIALSITEGRVIRDLLDGGLLDLLNNAGYNTIIFTPSARVESFVQTWKRDYVKFGVLKPFDWSSKLQRLYGIRKRIMRFGPRATKLFLNIEDRFTQADPEYLTALSKNNVKAIVITHPLHHGEYPLLRAAKQLQIPSLGILRSWDNFYRGLRLRPDIIAVWNAINAQEAMDMMKYDPNDIRIIGGTQFDPYFDQENIPSKEELCRIFNLDSTRPILTIATLGSFLPFYDESYLADHVLQAMDSNQIEGKPQLIIRLHPSSRLEYFQRYLINPDVRLSYISDYVPGIGWTMSRQQVSELAAILKHSNAVISPGSTITLETAIFDTPTLVPVFHTYQPELGRKIYERHLSTHFRRLAEQDLVPILNEPSELVPAINQALRDRSWYQQQRQQLLNDYIGFTDGHSIERLRDTILGFVSGEQN